MQLLVLGAIYLLYHNVLSPLAVRVTGLDIDTYGHNTDASMQRRETASPCPLTTRARPRGDGSARLPTCKVCKGREQV